MGESGAPNLQDVVAELIDQPPHRWTELLTTFGLTEEQRREVPDRLPGPGRAPARVIDAATATQEVRPLGQLNEAIDRAARVTGLNRFFDQGRGERGGPRYR